MRRSLLSGALLSLVCILPASSGAAPAGNPSDPNSPEFKRAADLIRQLGSRRFTVREAAARQLLEMGRSARGALQVGQHDPDPEVADRCRRLLPQAAYADFQVRLDAFLADKEGKQEHDLPGWDRFQKLMGKDKEGRELFAEMLKTNAELFVGFELEPKSFPDKYAGRCQELTGLMFAPQPGGVRAQPKSADLATVFFFGAEPDAARAIRNNQLVGNLLWQPAFQNTVRNGPAAESFKKLFLAWMEQRTDVNSVNHCLAMVQQLNIKEGVDFAARVMKNKEMQVYVRAQAATVLGKMGGKEHITPLEGLLDDDAQVGNFNMNGQLCITQMRDVALAMVIHLSGQKPQEFGFEFLKNQPNTVFSYPYLGFADDKERSAARKKWKEWAASHKEQK
jgi:hypothetical protein